jgi:hypothetical protein
LKIDAPGGAKPIDVTAELPSHFAESLVTLGFEARAGDNMPLDRPDPAKSPEVQARRKAAAAKTARKERKGERRNRGGGGTAKGGGDKGGTGRGQAVIRCAIFDCDGTLVDSGATIHRALGLAFAEHGLALPPRAQAQKVIGLSLVEAMQQLAPELDLDEHRRLAETYKQAFVTLRGQGQVDEPLFDGILPLLDALEERGWLLAVATGKSDRGLRHCLERHGIHHAFCRSRPQTGIHRNRILPWR